MGGGGGQGFSAHYKEILLALTNWSSEVKMNDG